MHRLGPSCALGGSGQSGQSGLYRRRKQEALMAKAASQGPAGSLEHLDEREVRKVLNTLKPSVDEAAPGHLDSVARVVSVVWDVIGELPQAKRRHLFNKDVLRAAVLELS